MICYDVLYAIAMVCWVIMCILRYLFPSGPLGISMTCSRWSDENTHGLQAQVHSSIHLLDCHHSDWKAQQRIKCSVLLTPETVRSSGSGAGAQCGNAQHSWAAVQGCPAALLMLLIIAAHKSALGLRDIDSWELSFFSLNPGREIALRNLVSKERLPWIYVQHGST